jgi:hypothetical protein
MTQTKLAGELDHGKVVIGSSVDRLENRCGRHEPDASDRRVSGLSGPKSKALIARLRVGSRHNANSYCRYRRPTAGMAAHVEGYQAQLDAPAGMLAD